MIKFDDWSDLETFANVVVNQINDRRAEIADYWGATLSEHLASGISNKLSSDASQIYGKISALSVDLKNAVSKAQSLISEYKNTADTLITQLEELKRVKTELVNIANDLKNSAATYDTSSSIILSNSTALNGLISAINSKFDAISKTFSEAIANDFYLVASATTKESELKNVITAAEDVVQKLSTFNESVVKNTTKAAVAMTDFTGLSEKVAKNTEASMQLADVLKDSIVKHIDAVNVVEKRQTELTEVISDHFKNIETIQAVAAGVDGLANVANTANNLADSKIARKAPKYGD